MDAKSRRISVTLPGEAGEAGEGGGEGGEDAGPLVVGATVKGKIQRIEGYGVFVWIRPGQVGLMPRAWTGTPEGTDMRRRFTIGEPIEAQVVEISEDGRKIRLAGAGVDVTAEKEPSRPRRRDRERDRDRDRDRGADRELVQSMSEDQGTFGTSLADKLREALGGGSDPSSK